MKIPPVATALYLRQDRYLAQLTAPSAGVYDVAWRFTADGGRSWTYCDAAPGSADGYQPAQAAHLTTRTPCRDQPTFEAVEVSCDGLDNDCDGDADEPCEVCGVDSDRDGTPDCIELELRTDPRDAGSVAPLFVPALQRPRVVQMSGEGLDFSIARQRPRVVQMSGEGLDFSIAPQRPRVVQMSGEGLDFSIALPVHLNFEEGPTRRPCASLPLARSRSPTTPGVRPRSSCPSGPRASRTSRWRPPTSPGSCPSRSCSNRGSGTRPASTPRRST